MFILLLYIHSDQTFIKKMGFGYGPKMYQYVVEPSSFPNTKEHLRYLQEQDQYKLKDCYNRVAAKKHGMFFLKRNRNL